MFVSGVLCCDSAMVPACCYMACKTIHPASGVPVCVVLQYGGPHQWVVLFDQMMGQWHG